MPRWRRPAWSTPCTSSGSPGWISWRRRFGPPAWRSAEEVISGEARYLADFFDGRVKGPLLLIALAVRIGKARLIDNVIV